MMIVALMGGALALAGCGGGSDSSPFENTPPAVQPQDPAAPGGDDPLGPSPKPGDEIPDPGQPGGGDPVVPPVEDPDPPEQPSDPQNPDKPAPGDDDPIVTPPVDRDVSLSWRAPTERENGDALPLAQLKGYRIYYGPMNNPTAFTVNVNDASLTAYTLKGLNAGTYRVAVSAIDTDGLESALSNTMTAVVE